MTNAADILKDIFLKFTSSFDSYCEIQYIGLKNQLDLDKNTCLLGFQLSALKRESFGGDQFLLRRTYRVPITLWTPLNFSPLNHAELIDKFQNFFFLTNFGGISQKECSGFTVYQDPQRDMTLSEMDFFFTIEHNSTDLSLTPDLKTLTKNITQPVQDAYLRSETDQILQDESDENLEKEEGNAQS